MNFDVRLPAVAGRFYPAEAEALRRTVLECLRLGEEIRVAAKVPKVGSPIGALVPHAGYVYSGPTAGSFYGSARIPDRVILIGPNHTGLGTMASVDPSRAWRSPLGETLIDDDLRSEIVASASILTQNREAHTFEHSLEVQIPFLQVVSPRTRIVPIILGSLTNAEAVELGRALARVIKSSEGEVLLIASSDMNHYEDQEATLVKDRSALQSVLALDPEALFNTVRRESISMCGVIPATVVLAACRELGAARAELVDHRTSGEASGDYDRVVGYASAVIR